MGKINFKNKTYYEAISEYAKVKFYVGKNGTLYIKAKFYDVNTISGIHIHTNYQGSSGPIIAWLATSPEWQHGVTQNTPLTNTTPQYACCLLNTNKKCGCESNSNSDSNTNTNFNTNMCSLIAPIDTPYTKKLNNVTKCYKIKKNVCSSCPWISDGTFLDIHGKDFQQVYSGGCKVVGSKPGIDMLESIPFTKIDN